MWGLRFFMLGRSVPQTYNEFKAQFDNPKLHSINFKDICYYDPAFCPTHYLAAPHVDCSCGYYAYKTVPPDTEGYVVGAVVWGYGRIVEHEEGWRASRIRIVHFVDRGTIPRESLDVLASDYAATVINGWPASLPVQVLDVSNRKEYSIEQYRQANQGDRERARSNSYADNSHATKGRGATGIASAKARGKGIAKGIATSIVVIAMIALSSTCITGLANEWNTQVERGVVMQKYSSKQGAYYAIVRLTDGSNRQILFEIARSCYPTLEINERPPSCLYREGRLVERLS